MTVTKTNNSVVINVDDVIVEMPASYDQQRQLTSSSKTKETSSAAEPSSPSGDQAASGGIRSTKNLAGFWANQNDEVKVRKKRLVQVGLTYASYGQLF